jgi:membrane fusion protein, multidrug efflux system
MRHWKILFGGAAVACVGATILVSTLRSGPVAAAAPAGPPAMPVPVISVIKRTIPVYLDYSARTESIREVSLQAKVAGYIQSQPAADGADVKESDLLYKIDDRDYRATLDQTKAEARRNVAALDYARSNFHRGDELIKTGFLAKDNYDQRASTLGQSEASVASNNASVRSAEINLAYTEIRAPFTGRLGRNRAPVGTLVGGSGFTLNTLVQLDPLYVTFNPSERDLGVIQTARSAGNVVAKVSLPDDASAHYSGELTFIDNGVDRTTGTITARATVPNPKFTLLPGQYVRVRLHVRTEDRDARSDGRRFRQRDRSRRKRPGDHRQSAKDRPRFTGFSYRAQGGFCVGREMRNLRVILRSLRRALRRWLTPPSETRSLSSIDPREFSDLLSGGQKKDLETLARRLSEHAAPSNARRPTRQTGHGASRSKGPGVTK